MPILIGVSPWAYERIGGENKVDTPTAAPALTIVRRSNGVKRNLFFIAILLHGVASTCHLLELLKEAERIKRASPTPVPSWLPCRLCYCEAARARKMKLKPERGFVPTRSCRHFTLNG